MENLWIDLDWGTLAIGPYRVPILVPFAVAITVALGEAIVVGLQAIVFRLKFFKKWAFASEDTLSKVKWLEVEALIEVVYFRLNYSSVPTNEELKTKVRDASRCNGLPEGAFIVQVDLDI